MRRLTSMASKRRCGARVSWSSVGRGPVTVHLLCNTKPAESQELAPGRLRRRRVAARRCSRCAGGLELQRDAVHAVAQAGRVRAVGEDMPEVAAALRAVDLGPGHAERTIRRGRDRAFDRGEKAGPAGAALELGVGGEQRLGAGGASEGSGPFLVIQRARSGALGPVLPQHVKLFRRQRRFPLLVGFRDVELLTSHDSSVLSPLASAAILERSLVPGAWDLGLGPCWVLGAECWVLGP